MATSCLRRNSSSIRSGNRIVNNHIGKRSRYGYYKFFVSEEAKNDILEYAPIAKRKCDTPENHLSNAICVSGFEHIKVRPPYHLMII